MKASAPKEFKVLEDRENIKKLLRRLGKSEGEYEFQDLAGNTKYINLFLLQNSIKEAGKRNENVFPEGPFKKSENQTKVALKALINLATKEGFDGVAIVTGKAKNKFASASGEVAKGNLGFYDGIAVKAMKNVAKNLDLDFSATNIKDGDGNTWAKIPLINLKEATVNKSVDLYKAEGGYIHRPSFVDVIPTLW